MKKVYWVIIIVLLCALLTSALIVIWQTISKRHAARVGRLKEAIQKKDSELTRMQQEVEGLTSEKSLLDRRKLEFNKKLSLLEEKVRDAKEKEDSYSAQVKALYEEKRQLEAEMTKTIESMQDELQQRADKIRTEAAYKGKQFFDQEKELLTEIKSLKAQLDDSGKAKTALEKEMIELFSGLIEAKTKLDHYNLGFAYEIEGNYQAAVREYEEILKINRREAYANMRLASIYIYGIKDPDRASYYAKAYAHSKNPIKTGQQIDHDLVEAAEKEIESTIKLNVAEQTLEYINMQKLKFHYNYGLIYDNMGRYDEAIIEYKKALEQKPDDADTHYNLGIVYDQHIKDKKKAIHHYEKYLEVCKNPDDIKNVEDWIAIAKGDLDWQRKMK